MATDHPRRGPRSADGPVVGQTGARFGGTAGRRSRASTRPPTDEDAEATRHHRDDQARDDQIDDQVSVDEACVGQTGARFPGVMKRWRHTRDPELEDVEPAAEDTGARPPPEAPQDVPRPAVASSVPELYRVSETEWASGSERGAVKEAAVLVRPYFWTGGRTASRFDLSFETLVSATRKATDPATSPEHRTILEICATPQSVAEVAALLSMPLGVARVMLGDMADAGSVVVHRTAGSADAAPDIELMRRVLAGLQRL